MSVSNSGPWYWCLRHSTVEPADGCAGTDRMGPYESAEEARNWRQRVAARNEAWDAEDEGG